MPTVSAGDSGSTTISGAQTVTISPDSGELAAFDVTRSGVQVYGGTARAGETVGPFQSGDVFTLTAVRGAVDYTVTDAYIQYAVTAQGRNGDYSLIVDGGVVSLSEVMPEVLATATATSTQVTGAGVYGWYRCTTATGNITIYDNTAASGKVLVPTTALAVGVFPIGGDGNPTRLAVSTGVTTVLSGAGVVYIGCETG